MQTLSYKKDKKILTFQAVGETYTIGSKAFPLSQKKNIGLWYADNTVEVTPNQLLLQYLDAVTDPVFTTGKCYRNAEVVRQVGEKLHLNIKYFSGWLFSNDALPFHHAWNVLDNRIIIDTSYTKTYFRIHERMMQYVAETEHFTKDEYRQRYVQVYEEEIKNQQPISQELLYGKVSPYMAYIGTPDTYENAQTIISDLLDGYEEKGILHPSYQHSRDELGRSETQLLLKEKGLFQ